MQNKENSQKKDLQPLILKSLAKKQAERDSLLSPKTRSTSGTTRLRSSDSKISFETVESKVLRDCEELLHRVKKQHGFYKAVSLISPNYKQQTKLENTVKALQDSVKSKDKAILKLHGIVRQLENDYAALMKSAMMRGNAQAFEQYGFELPKEQSPKVNKMNRISRFGSLRQSVDKVKQTKQPRPKDPVKNCEIGVQTESVTSSKQDEGENNERRFKQECLQREKEMGYQTKVYCQRIQELEIEVGMLRKRLKKALESDKSCDN